VPAGRNREARLVAARARSLAHPTRVAVLRELEVLGVASPRMLAERLAQPLGAVSYHVRALRRWRLVELSRTVARRGAVEHYYRLAREAEPVLRTLDMLARMT
jgi:DNA-binding transcriptional ArsR family regulator